MLSELLTPIRLEQAVRYVLDPRFWMQQKRDGIRLLVRKQNGHISGWNKQGQPVAVAPELVQSLVALDVSSFVLDGELEKGRNYFCWDLLEVNGTDLKSHSYRDRLAVLTVFARCSVVRVLDTWTTAADKERVLLDLHQRRAEGVVFKDCNAVYRPGRAGQHYKLKFEKTATARVRAVDSIRDRISVEMLDGSAWHEVWPEGSQWDSSSRAVHRGSLSLWDAEKAAGAALFSPCALRCLRRRLRPRPGTAWGQMVPIVCNASYLS